MDLKNNPGFNSLSKESKKQIRKLCLTADDETVKQEIECRLLGGDY